MSREKGYYNYNNVTQIVKLINDTQLQIFRMVAYAFWSYGRARS